MKKKDWKKNELKSIGPIAIVCVVFTIVKLIIFAAAGKCDAQPITQHNTHKKKMNVVMKTEREKCKFTQLK